MTTQFNLTKPLIRVGLKISAILGLSVMTCLSGPLFGQLTTDTIYLEFEVIGVDQGLSAGMAIEVAQDNQGYLWIATTQGLNRYDGYRVKEFTHIQGDSLSLLDNYVHTVFVDSRGWLWVSTKTDGLFLYDATTDAFLPLNVNTIGNLYEDCHHHIWFTDPSLERQIVYIDSAASTSQHLSERMKHMRVHPATEVYAGLPDSTGWIPALFDHYGVWYVNQSTLVAYDLKGVSGKAAIRTVIRLQDISVHPTHRIVEDKDRNKIYVADGEVLYELDPRTGAVRTTQSIRNSAGIKYEDFTLVDGYGRIWVIGQDNRLLFLDPVKHTLTVAETNVDEIFLNWTSYAQNPYVDRDENVWMPSSGYGVFKYNCKRERFKYFGNKHIGPSMPPTVQVSPGLILFYRWDKVFDIEKGIIRPLDAEVDLSDHANVRGRGAMIDLGGDVWVGSSYDSIWVQKLDTTGKVIGKRMFIPENPFPAPYDGPGVTLRRKLILRDLVWIYMATYQPPGMDQQTLVIMKMHMLSGEQQLYTTDLHVPKDFSLGGMNGLVTTSDGKSWILMTEGGIIALDTAKSSIVHYYHREDDHKSLSNDRTLSCILDPDYPDSILWIGTERGLERMDMRNGTFEHFTTDRGLPNNVVYGVLSDARKNLWLSTNRGLCLFNPRTFEARNFTKQDGLQHNEFNVRAYLKAKDGTLFFGGVGGLTWFDPKDFYQHHESSRIVINGIQIDNKDITFSRMPDRAESTFYLDQPIEYTSTITLRHFHRMVTIEFATLDLTKPEGNQYRYQLEEFNRDWIEAGTQHHATYTNLPPGEYTFKVQGKNSENVWNREGARLNIIVLPPWWATLWFKGIVFAAVMSLLYGFYRYRMRQKEHVQALRNRISRDLHDEIGSTLSSISLFGTVAQKRLTTENPGVADMLTKINESSTRVMESINDIVWAINADNDKMEHVINRMRAFTSEISDASGWRVRYEHDPGLTDIPIDMVQRRNVYLVFKEAVNNAVKYSKGTHLLIQLRKESTDLILCIKDDGVGFDSEAADVLNSLGGNGLRNMRIRANELNGELEIVTAPGIGTEIQLKWKAKFQPSL